MNIQIVDDNTLSSYSDKFKWTMGSANKGMDHTLPLDEVREVRDSYQEYSKRGHVSNSKLNVAIIDDYSSNEEKATPPRRGINNNVLPSAKRSKSSSKPIPKSKIVLMDDYE